MQHWYYDTDRKAEKQKKTCPIATLYTTTIHLSHSIAIKM
jgi:hypothetical protein